MEWEPRCLGTNTPSLATRILWDEGRFIFNKVVTHGTVVAGRVDLREVVAVVDCPWGPGDGKFPPLDSVAYPVLAHVYSFGTF